MAERSIRQAIIEWNKNEELVARYGRQFTRDQVYRWYRAGKFPSARIVVNQATGQNVVFISEPLPPPLSLQPLERRVPQGTARPKIERPNAVVIRRPTDASRDWRG